MTTVDLPTTAGPSGASDLLDSGRAFKKQLSNSSTSAEEAREAAMGPYQRQASAGVSQELRNRLASVGMHARFNVNRGYASPPNGLSPSCSSTNPFGASSNLNALGAAPIFSSSRDTAQAVSRTRSKWSRTSSAPSASVRTRELQPYGGSLKLDCLSSAGEDEDDDDGDGFDPSVLQENIVGAPGLQQQGMDSPSSASFGQDLKRAREDVLGSFMDEDEDDEMMSAGTGIASSALSGGVRPVQPFPSRRSAGLGSRTAASAGFARGAPGASTMPVGSSRMTDFIMDAQRDEHAEWEQHDFSTAAQRMDEF